MAVSYYLNQNYEELKEEWREMKIPFRDNEFPANSYSLGISKVVEWRRVKDISNNPQFIVNGTSRFDVNQRELGDCWFVAAVAAITRHKELFDQVVPKDQDFQSDYAGIFRFRFWRENQWFEVVVDDRLPCNQLGELIYLRNHDQPNEFWSPLLEKAYAKFHGSYAHLYEGVAEKALSELTGGIAYPNNIKSMSSNLIWESLVDAFKMDCLLTCSIITKDWRIIADRVTEKEINYSNGVLMKHTYTITKISEKETLAYGKQRLIRMQNPWGKIKCRKDGSERSLRWNDIHFTKHMKYQVGMTRCGGLWMHVDDFVNNFHFLTICYLPGRLHLQTNGIPLRTLQAMAGDDAACGCRMRKKNNNSSNNNDKNKKIRDSKQAKPQTEKSERPSSSKS